MPLNKDVLGLALYTRRNAFCDMDMDEILMMYTTLDNARLAMAKADAEEIINHFKTNIEINIPAAGLVSVSGGGPVTGTALTGTIN